MDLYLVETHDGGDFVFNGKDLVMVYGIENHAYIGMFGGNKEQDTPSVVVESESFDFWGNSLLMTGNKSIQVNSGFERALDNIPLTSSGRVRLINTIKDDLNFMTAYTTVEVIGSIPSTDRFDVEITITQNTGAKQVIIINYRKESNGDYSIIDFNNDFNI